MRSFGSVLLLPLSLAFIFLSLVNAATSTITITSPKNSIPNQVFDAGSTVQVKFVLSPLPHGPFTANVNLYCPSIALSSSQATDKLSLSFVVPSNFYGDDCYFNVDSSGYSTSSNVYVTIAQTLTFFSPSNNAVITIDDPIRIYLSTGRVTINTTVTLGLVCTNYAAIPPFNVPTSTDYDYIYPSGVYGPCTLSVVSAPSYFIIVNSVSFNLKYDLTVVAAPTIYVGQNFSTFIACPVNSVIPTVTLDLLYTPIVGSPTIVQSYTVTINAPTTLTAPTSLTIGPGYILQVASDANFIEADSNPLTVSNVQLRFSQPPAGSTYAYLSTIPILIDSADVSSILPSSQPISVTLTCGSSTVDTFTVNIGTQSNYANPNGGVGSCTLSASSSISYLLSPSNVALTLQGTVSISSPASVAAGQSASIGLTYLPTPSSAVSSDITLTCPNITPFTYSGSGASINFPVPSTFFGSSCIFSVSANYYVASGTSSSIITQPLAFTSPASNDIITINDPIIVGMSTGSVNASASVDLQLSCASYTSPIPTFTVITSSYVPYSYSSYPSGAYGPCTLSVVSAPNYLVLPSDLSISLKYNVSIAPPSIIYIGQQFLATVSCALCSVNLNVGLDLVYTPSGGSPTIVQSYTVTVNQQATLNAPTSLTTGPGYTLQVASDANFNGETSSAFSASNVQLRFSQPPAGSAYVYNSAIPILIDSADVSSILPSNQPISVTLTCSSTAVDTFSVNIGTQIIYANPNGRFGDCVLSAVSSVSYLLSPAPVPIILQGTVAISPVASSIPAGQAVQLGLTYYPATTTASSTVILTCPNFDPESVPVTGIAPLFTVPNGFYGNSCVFSVTSQYFFANNTVSTIVTQDLLIASPTASSSYIMINDTIPIKVATSPNTTISESVNMKFSCLSPSTMPDQFFDVITSSSAAFDYQYPSSAFGFCALSVNSASSYFTLPAPLNLSLQYNVSIIAPQKITPSLPFLVTVTCAQTPAISNVTLELVYYSSVSYKSFNSVSLTKRYNAARGVTSSVIQSYNVPINQQTTLIAPNDLLLGTSYTLQLAPNPYFNSSTSPSVVAIIIQTLNVTTPASITFGQKVPLRVDTDGPMPIDYTASFACPSGSYQITGLKTGMNYNIVPAGIYGRVVITVTAVNAMPAQSTLTIFKASANIPPAFIPGRLPSYPSVYLSQPEEDIEDFEN